jgi:alpha-L-rhamnosidase
LNDSTYVFDFGRNMAGITELAVQGDRDTEVRIAHGERLAPDGHVHMGNINKFYGGDKVKAPFGTDIYWLSGGNDRYASTFSYKGFRYAEVVTSKPINLTAESLTAWRTNTDMTPVGSISSSNPLLGKIMDATRAAYLSNFVGYPTDCPHREKNGWTGDAHLAIEMALYNFDAITAYEQWMSAHRDEQQPNGMLPNILPTSGWGYDFLIGIDWVSTTAIIPWQLYMFYVD